MRWADIRTYAQDLGLLFRNGNSRQKRMASLNQFKKLPLVFLLMLFPVPLFDLIQRNTFYLIYFFISLQCLRFNSIFFLSADFGYFLLQCITLIWSVFNLCSRVPQIVFSYHRYHLTLLGIFQNRRKGFSYSWWHLSQKRRELITAGSLIAFFEFSGVS